MFLRSDINVYMFANAGVSSILETCFISLSCVDVMTLQSYEAS